MFKLDHFKNLNFVSYILILLLSIQLGFFIWAINRGFDFTDEAYGYLGFKNPEEIHGAGTYYSVIFSAFFGWMNVSIIKVRIIRLLLLLLCGSVFAFGLLKWWNRKASISVAHRINLFLFILIGSLLINANGSQSFTYNLSSTLLFQLVVGGV